MGNRVSAQAKTKTTVLALVDHTTNMVVKTKTETITEQTFLAHPMVDGLPRFSQTVTVPANTMLTVTQSSPSSMQFKLPHSDQVLVAERPADVTYQSTGHPLGKAAVNQLARDGRRWAKGLTFGQRQAVTDYTSEGYEDINAALRNPRTRHSNGCDEASEGQDPDDAVVWHLTQPPLQASKASNNSAILAGHHGVKAVVCTIKALAIASAFIGYAC